MAMSQFVFGGHATGMNLQPISAAVIQRIVKLQHFQTNGDTVNAKNCGKWNKKRKSEHEQRKSEKLCRSMKQIKKLMTGKLTNCLIKFARLNEKSSKFSPPQSWQTSVSANLFARWLQQSIPVFYQCPEKRVNVQSLCQQQSNMYDK